MDRLSNKQGDFLVRALTLEERFQTGIFPRGAQHRTARILERSGLLKFDGWGRDMDGLVEEDVMVYALTDKGREMARLCNVGGVGEWSDSE